jgi:prepilin-type N-terminal cleavage/methylation domain-containing protein
VRPSGKSHYAGFTLIEIMIAISLAAVITTMLASSLWMTLQFNERLEESQNRYSDLADRLRLLRFAGAAVTGHHPARLHSGFSLTSEGTKTTLTAWISPGLFTVSGAETDPCRLILQTQATGGIRMTIEPDYFGSLSETVPDYDRLLFDDFGRCQIEALSCDGLWNSTWNTSERDALPQAIRIRFLSNINGFSDIIIPLYAAGEC